MRLYILEKSLNDIRGVTLHGIKPFHEETIVLGDGKDYVLKTREVKLPIKDVGAYLVVASSEDLIASDMVLVNKPQGQRQLEGQSKGKQTFEALENLRSSNRGAQQRNVEYLNELYKNDQQGVQVQKAK